MIKQAFILAGGLGTRLGALTQRSPKPMMQIGEKPFLAYLIDNLSRHGIKKIILSVGYLGEQIASYFGDGSRLGVAIKYVHEASPAGTAGALKLAEAILEDSFLMLNGDTLFDFNYLDLALFHAEHPTSVASIALRPEKDTERYGNIRLTGELITAFTEKPPAQHEQAPISSGVYVLNKKILNYIAKIPASIEKDVFPVLVEEKNLYGKIYPESNFFIDIGLPDTLSLAKTSIPRWLMKPAILLDRDGVLNVDKHYVHQAQDFEWMPGAIAAIKSLNDAGYLVFLVTNQAGIARGYYSEELFLQFSQWINAELKKMGAHIDQIYYCPHHDISGKGIYLTSCACRKPKSGMLLRAMSDYKINKEKSFMIGDKDKDVSAGKQAGLTAHQFVQDNLLEFIINKIGVKSFNS